MKYICIILTEMAEEGGKARKGSQILTDFNIFFIFLEGLVILKAISLWAQVNVN